MMAFPGTLMALVVVAVLGQGTVNVMLAVGVSLVPTFVRLVRGDVLSVRENVYVEAARALGCWPTRVAVQHVLPNVVAPIIVLSTVAIAWSIILGASLSFLGLGPRPDRKSTRLNSSHTVISYAVFCLKKKKKPNNNARWYIEASRLQVWKEMSVQV